MWSSVLHKHFPPSLWKKYYPKIMFHILSVFYNLKPSFLWDFGPVINSHQLLVFVKDIKSSLNIIGNFLIISVGDNIFLSNPYYCLNELYYQKFFVEIGNSAFKIITPSESENLSMMIQLLKSKLRNLEECAILEFPVSEDICTPALFGLLLNYPVIYYYCHDYKFFPTNLKVFSVSCQFLFDKMSDEFQVFSFSVPQNLIDNGIDNHVFNWFQRIQPTDEKMFFNLNVKSSFKSVDALIL